MAGQRRPSVEIWLNVRTPYHPKKTLDNLHTLTSFPLSTHWSLSLRYENESGKRNSGVHQHTHLQLLQRDKHFKISSAFSLYNIFLSCGTVVSSKYCSQTQYFHQREFTVLFWCLRLFFYFCFDVLEYFPAPGNCVLILSNSIGIVPHDTLLLQDATVEGTVILTRSLRREVID